jgi:pimeloyl-ACP methyl ester carboxylesterase
MLNPDTIRLRDGRQLAYLESGDPNGKPIFLIQGTPSSRLMRPAETITRELGARLVMFDRPGFGLSDYQPHRIVARPIYRAKVICFCFRAGAKF